MAWHVIPSGNGSWEVRSNVSDRTVVRSNKGEAVKDGRHLAKKSASELYIHGRDGRIQERNSYGNAPVPAVRK